MAQSYYDLTDRGRATPKARQNAILHYCHNYDSYLPRETGKTAIDLGCSEGTAVEWLLRHPFEEVIGVDSDTQAVSLAESRLSPRASFVAGDILGVLRTRPDASTDVITMLNVIEHLEKGYMLSTLREIFRVLRAGGIVIAQTGNIENPFNFGLYARDLTHEIAFSSNSLRQAFRMGGFSQRDLRIGPVSYRTTVKNFPLALTAALCGATIRGLARAMRIRIDETAPMIYAVARKPVPLPSE